VVNQLKVNGFQAGGGSGHGPYSHSMVPGGFEVTS
jgi:hypothetical protein